MTFEQNPANPNMWKVTSQTGDERGSITRGSDGLFTNTPFWKGESSHTVQTGPFKTLEAAQQAFRVGFGE